MNTRRYIGVMACAALASSSLALAQQRTGSRMTAHEVAAAVKNLDQTLSSGIAAAERHVGGKAVDAECFGQEGTEPVCMVTVLTNDNKLVETKVSKSGQVLGQTNVETAPGVTAQQLTTFNKNNQSVTDCIQAAERQVRGGKAVQVEAFNVSRTGAQGTPQDTSCMVRLLTDDNRLVEVSVTQTGQVLGQQNIEAITLGSAFTVAPTIASERTTMAPPGTTTTRTTTTRPGTPADGEMASADEFSMAKRWQKATDLMGKNVTNSANENLGELHDIVIDSNSGRILYGVLSFGGFLGLGDKLFAIPWPSLRLGPDYKAFVLNVEKGRLKEAQGFDKSQWPNFADERWATSTYTFYNQRPYWQDRGVERSPTLGTETTVDPATFRKRWHERVTVWHKVSDLVGKNVHNPKNENLGEIKDLAIDPDNGRILYAVVGFRGKLFPVPFNALNLSDPNKKAVLNVDKEALKDSIAFTDNNWPNIIDPRWASDIHTVYGVQPYWVDVPPARIEEKRDNRP